MSFLRRSLNAMLDEAPAPDPTLVSISVVMDQIQAQTQQPPPGVPPRECLFLVSEPSKLALTSSDGRCWPFNADAGVLVALAAEGWRLGAIIPPSSDVRTRYFFDRPLPIDATA